MYLCQGLHVNSEIPESFFEQRMEVVPMRREHHAGKLVLWRPDLWAILRFK